VSRRKGLSRGGFELKDIQCIGRTLDNVVSGLSKSISKRQQSGEQWATGEELQERPAISHGVPPKGKLQAYYARASALDAAGLIPSLTNWTAKTLS